jgi:RNAse (barnase) inhibitor barstar
MTAPRPLLDAQNSPALLVLEAEPAPAAEAAMAWVEAGLTVRALRGEKMRSTDSLMDEFAAALQFPHYFGANWAALGECLADMDWLLPTTGIVALLRNAEQVLVEEPSVELEALIAVIGKASREYAQPIERGEWWDRPAVPFHCVLQAVALESTAVERRWTAAGGVVEPLAL